MIRSGPDAHANPGQHVAVPTTLAAVAPPRAALAVVIATRNRPERLLAAVRSVLRDASAPDLTVVIVDQSDTDCTQRLLQEHLSDADRLRYVRAPGHGAAAARNLGVRLSHADIIAISDDDCMVPPDWASAVRATFAAHPQVDVLFGAVDPVPHDRLRSFVPTFTPCERRFEARLGDARDFHGMSAHMAVRREVFDALGGFDERFGVGALARSAEDFDLHFRALCAGRGVLIEPALRVVHANVRPMSETWGLWRRDAHGSGALGARMLLEGHPRAAWRLWRGLVGRPAVTALGRLVRRECPTGLRCVATLALGFAAGAAHWPTIARTTGTGAPPAA